MVVQRRLGKQAGAGHPQNIAKCFSSVLARVVLERDAGH